MKGKKTGGRDFPKGKSGNPGGRPAGLKEVTDKAQEHGPGVIAFMAAVYRDQKKNIRARIEAGKVLLERGYGRPNQTQDVTVQSGGVIIKLPPKDE